MPKLSRPIRFVLAGQLVSSIGTGTTLPYLFVFLQEQQGLDAGLIGTLLTVRAITAVAGAGVGGLLVDRIGAHRSSLLGLAVAAVSTLALLWVTGPVKGVVILALYGLVGSALGTAMQALVGHLAVSEEERLRAFGKSYIIGNVGGAGGALLATLVLALGHSSGYSRLYLVDAVSFLVMALILWRWVEVPSPGPHGMPSGTADTLGFNGYRLVFGDRVMRWVCVTVALVCAAGYSQLSVALPAFAAERGLAHELGWLFAANMIAGVSLQGRALKIAARWKPGTGIVAGIVAMMSAWTLVQLMPDVTIGTLVAVGLLFAAGEIFLLPVVEALVNDRAPGDLRGRYNGAFSLAWTGGWLGGTVLVGVLLSADLLGGLFLILTLLLGLAALSAIRLRSQLNKPLDESTAPSLHSSVIP